MKAQKTMAEMIEIRLAQFEDIPALERLLERSVRGLSGGYYTQRQIDSALVHAFSIDRQLVADGTYYLAELAEARQIVGCGGWSQRRTLHGGDHAHMSDESILDPAVDAARIRAFFIDPDFARRGIGRRIIETCEAAAQAAGFTRLVLGSTLPGEPMYAALGYVAVERIAHPMADGEILPLVVMEKRIAG
ncbi:MAG: GNAT family N-acetyltransferase [Blastocatellia bacterium]|nr:GNAT family N-acetyltransferase [Blastocatellia bacterium]